MSVYPLNSNLVCLPYVMMILVAEIIFIVISLVLWVLLLITSLVAEVGIKLNIFYPSIG